MVGCSRIQVCVKRRNKYSSRIYHKIYTLRKPFRKPTSIANKKPYPIVYPIRMRQYKSRAVATHNALTYTMEAVGRGFIPFPFVSFNCNYVVEMLRAGTLYLQSRVSASAEVMLMVQVTNGERIGLNASEPGFSKLPGYTRGRQGCVSWLANLIYHVKNGMSTLNYTK